MAVWGSKWITVTVNHKLYVCQASLRPRQSGAYGTSHASDTLDTPLLDQPRKTLKCERVLTLNLVKNYQDSNQKCH